LSKDQEEQMLYRNMGNDLVGQIVRRMAALTSL
jgi:outer membrane lipopolysaccharide assembly protein LptE/RlpB